MTSCSPTCDRCDSALCLGTATALPIPPELARLRDMLHAAARNDLEPTELADLAPVVEPVAVDMRKLPVDSVGVRARRSPADRDGKLSTLRLGRRVVIPTALSLSNCEVPHEDQDGARSPQDQVRRPAGQQPRPSPGSTSSKPEARGKPRVSFGCGWSIAGLAGDWFGDIPLPSGRTESQIQRLQSRPQMARSSGISPVGLFGHLTDWVI
jgi:hypothetical protein